jgi:hypothetical protein
MMRCRFLLSGLVLVSLAAVTVRLWLAWNAPPSVDLENYEDTVRVIRAGTPLYETADHYNYSPVWSWALRLADGIAAATGCGFSSVVRTGLLAIDLGCAALLFLLAREGGPTRQWRATALYLANPVGIWVTAVQGQFDVLALFFLLAALQVSRSRSEGEKSALPQMALLTLSVASKHLTLFHPILFVRRRQDLKWLALPYLATAALFLPYASQWRAIRDRVLLYRSVPRSYGFSEFVLYDARMAAIVSALAFAAGLTAACFLRKYESQRACLILFLVLLFFAPGLGSQYLLWPLTLGALRPGLGYFVFTGASILWILGSHFDLAGSGQFMGQLVWLSVALWGVREIRSLRKAQRGPRLEPAPGQPAQGDLERLTG